MAIERSGANWHTGPDEAEVRHRRPDARRCGRASELLLSAGGWNELTRA
jgi:hypothetical protein